MIGYYLSSNNKMCYSIKTQTFSPTKCATVPKPKFEKVHCDRDDLLVARPLVL